MTFENVLGKIIPIRKNLMTFAVATFFFLAVILLLLQTVVSLKFGYDTTVTSRSFLTDFNPINLVWQLFALALMIILWVPEWYRYISEEFSGQKLLEHIGRTLFLFIVWVWWMFFFYSLAIEIYATVALIVSV